MKLFNEQSMFVVNSYSTHVVEWKERREEILSLVNFNVEGHDKISDNLAYSDYNLYNQEDSPYRKSFLEMLEPYLKEFRENVFQYNQVTGVWCQKYLSGDYHGPHDHGPIGYSAVFYAKINADVHLSTLFYSPFRDNVGVVGSKSYKSVEGDLRIFPAYLLHTAPPHKSDEDRIIFSFNLL
jgi:hypothetical protein